MRETPGGQSLCGCKESQQKRHGDELACVRYLTNVVVRPGTCFVQSGTLHDPYTGTTTEFVRGPNTSDNVEIDHVVSLADAWYKGAQFWDPQRRQDFANDPRELLAVSPKATSTRPFAMPLHGWHCHVKCVSVIWEDRSGEQPRNGVV